MEEFRQQIEKMKKPNKHNRQPIETNFLDQLTDLISKEHLQTI